ncbi:hypothetical protein GCM10022416_60620 [Actinomadura keratinilytica]|jgi:hypothetical protein|uniref:Uncharacterized protein n=1 Tax=Actinomadura keratinilytica TaxID=547461 RepID=A0ABP6UGM6_9ACTN
MPRVTSSRLARQFVRVACRRRGVGNGRPPFVRGGPGLPIGTTADDGGKATGAAEEAPPVADPLTRPRWSAGSKAGGRPLLLSGLVSATGITAATLAAL